MRRVFVAAVACAAVLLIAVPAALALGAPLHPVGHARVAAHAPHAHVGADRTLLSYEPLARRILTGTATISLNVYSFTGSPEAGARADWWVFGDSDYGTGHGFTDASGHVDMTGVPAATNDNGEITVTLDNSENTLYDLGGLSWPDTGWIGGLQPGRLPVTVVQSTDENWNYWTSARVRLWRQQGDESHLARTDIVRTSSTTSSYARTITTGSEQLTAGTLYFWDDEGMELPVAGTAVSPGTTAGPGVTAREADAQRVWMDYWGSGKPGTRTMLIMDNFPAGWTNRISGIADWPQSAAPKSFGTSTSAGDRYTTLPMTIPSGAAPGYSYWVAAEHVGGTLALWTSFQTCTLKPSRATVSANTSISLAGIVPIKGHEGSKKGTPKYVTVYKTTSAKTAKWQPQYFGGKTVKGWTKVGRVRTDGLGKYKLSTRPGKTSWYCAWYAGDSWYWGAWTSVAKVTVR